MRYITPLKKHIFILGVGLSALLSIYLVTYLVENAIQQKLNIEQTELLEVNKGDSISKVIHKMNSDGRLTRTLFLRAYIKLNADNLHIKKGTYELTTGMTVETLFLKLTQGDVLQYPISLIEGLVWKQWKQTILSHEAIVDDLNEETLIQQLGVVSLEGRLMPDTYFITQNTSATEFITRLFEENEKFVAAQWEARPPLLPYKNKHEVLIMASIIEKETGLASERAHIASVFVNRLESGMRLQMDSTIIYGLGDRFDGDLKKHHMREHTPYNTYVIDGMPPTPIAMSGKEAIIATLNPLITEDVYFVAKGDGSHQFSETLEEHNKAVRKYQLGGK